MIDVISQFNRTGGKTRLKNLPVPGFRTAREFHIFLITAAVLFSLSLFLHFYCFGEVPNGFYLDECSVGYNAYCIAETGSDEFGMSFPLFFKCFDNYQDPVMIYTLVPLVKMFGLEKWVVRLPSSLFHILASVSFFFLALKYARNRWICIGGAFVFSILPWCFPLSRIGMGGYMPMLLGMIGGWYFLIEAMGRNSKKLAVAAGFCWSFAMYSHHIGKPMTAVILIIFVISFNILLIKRWKTFCVFIASYVIFLVPMIISVILNPVSMTSRFSDISVFNVASGPAETVSMIFTKYFEYLSPSFLFVSGDPILRHHPGESGELYVFMFPFIIAGIYCGFRNVRRNPYMRFLLLGLIVFSVAAIITVEQMVSTRVLNGSISWGLTSVLGAAFMWKKRKNMIFKLLLFSLLFFSVLESTLYMKDYFGDYVERSRLNFAAPYTEALEFSFKNLKPGETLYVSPSVIPQKIDEEFQPLWYMTLLFFGRVPPLAYQKEGLPSGYVRSFQGRASRGLLIRLNIIRFITTGGELVCFQNTEPVPEKSSLLTEIYLKKGFRDRIEIYRLE